jgi:PAS domain S-box-containing protein
MAKATEKTKVLIVDDDENFTNVTATFLESKGYQVQTVNTGAEALEMVSSENLQIVLLDLVLPDAEGIDVLKKIRHADRNIAIITVTGYGDEHRAVNVMKAGSCDYLTKPFRLNDLVYSIEKASSWREVQIIEDMSEGFLAVDERRIVYANRVVEDVLGYSREELAGMDISRLFPKKESGVFERRSEESQGAWRSFEIEAVHKDGSSHTLGVRVANDSLKGMEVIAVLFKDITATKHLEAALKETQTLYENLIRNANDAITLINPEGRFALVNPKFCELSGYSEEETRSLHFSKLIHPEDLHLFADRFRRALAGEKVANDYQFGIVRKTGEILFIDFNANVITKDGKIIGIQAIARDITQRKQAEKERQERMRELEKWHKLTVDRELRMIELKKKIEELESQLAHIKKLKRIE